MQLKFTSLSDLDAARVESSQKHHMFIAALYALKPLISEAAMNALVDAYIDSRKASYDLGIATAVLGDAEAEWERARGLTTRRGARWGGRQRKPKNA